MQCIVSSSPFVNFCSRNSSKYKPGIWTTACWVVFRWIRVDANILEIMPRKTEEKKIVLVCVDLASVCGLLVFKFALCVSSCLLLSLQLFGSFLEASWVSLKIFGDEFESFHISRHGFIFLRRDLTDLSLCVAVTLISGSAQEPEAERVRGWGSSTRH